MRRDGRGCLRWSPTTKSPDYSEPYTIMLEALEEVFGKSKKIEWWLEHPLNHAPKDLMVCRHGRPRCECTYEDMYSVA